MSIELKTPRDVQRELAGRFKARRLELRSLDGGGLSVRGILDPVGGATLRTATVRRPRPVVLIVRIANGKLAVERVVDAEQPSSDVNLVVVV